MAARHVIAAALSDRHQQLRGEAFPMDYDGARLILAALETDGYTITKTDDGAGASTATPSPADGATSLPAPSSDIPRLFVLDRHVDVTGLSGTGVVAEGAQWSDKTASLRWLGAHPSTVAWASVDQIIAVHGHGGATELRWLDGEM